MFLTPLHSQGVTVSPECARKSHLYAKARWHNVFILFGWRNRSWRRLNRGFRLTRLHCSFSGSSLFSVSFETFSFWNMNFSVISHLDFGFLFLSASFFSCRTEPSLGVSTYVYKSIARCLFSLMMSYQQTMILLESAWICAHKSCSLIIQLTFLIKLHSFLFYIQHVTCSSSFKIDAFAFPASQQCQPVRLSVQS